MRKAKKLCCRYLANCAAAGLFFLLPLPCSSQSTVQSPAQSSSQSTVKPQPEIPFADDLKKYPGLLTELAHLTEALKTNVPLPPVRTESHVLPHLPAAITYYAAFPNYGETAHQTLETLRQELQASAVLRDWWQHGELSSAGPKLLEFLEKFYEVSQYLGDEVVVSGEMGEAHEKGGANFLIVAQLRKPGLKKILEQFLKESSGESRSQVRILDLEELARAKSGTGVQQLVVLVRPDFVIATENLEALRSFNTFLDARTTEFASTPFGQRLTEAYQGGTSALMAADLHTILNQIPPGTEQNQKMFERTGFKDAKYVVWKYRHKAQGSTSQMELSFAGPRHGVASWLAAPAPLGSLSFVSPQAAIVSSVNLKNLGEIFDDIKELSSYSNPNGLASVTQMEKALHLRLKDDLLGLLPGEITVEAHGFNEPKPEWKIILRTSDADHLQQTLAKILATTPLRAVQFEEDGTTYHSLVIPSTPDPVQIVYAFADGYLIAASSHETAAAGIQLHKSGESFAKSTKFLESLPAGSPADVSVLVYEDPTAVAALNLRRLSPEMAEAFARISPATVPIVFRAYGEESAIRGTSTSGAADASVILIAAAVAIPNLMRARMAANESSAVANMRTIVVAQVMYSNAYPDQGYAPDLATLGPDPAAPTHPSQKHASVLDATLGNPSCTSGAWCPKSGYNFRLMAACRPGASPCKEFVAVATPASSSGGTKSFCSTSDGVVRYKLGPPLISPVSPSECLQWAPVQ
jgi:type II secretory pathway pseudopilin PulG